MVFWKTINIVRCMYVCVCSVVCVFADFGGFMTFTGLISMEPGGRLKDVDVGEYKSVISKSAYFTVLFYPALSV